MYNVKLKNWTKFSGINAETLAIIENTVTDLDEIYHGDYTGLVYVHDDTVDTDNGSAIDGYWKTGWIDFAGQDAKISVRDKTLRRFYGYQTLIGAATGNLTFTLYVNASTTASDTRTMSIASTARQFFDTSVQGHMHQIKISQAEASQPFQLNKLAIGLFLNEEVPGT